MESGSERKRNTISAAINKLSVLLEEDFHGFRSEIWNVLSQVYDAGKKSNPKHGDPIECKTCGSPGRFDEMKQGGDTAEFDDAVWWNRYINGWECYYCWLK